MGEHEQALYEKAARKLCEMRGIEPDETTFDTPNGWRAKRWHLVIDEIIAHDQCAQALAAARG